MPLGLHGDLRRGVSLEAGKARGRFTKTNRKGWQQDNAFEVDTTTHGLYLGMGFRF